MTNTLIDYLRYAADQTRSVPGIIGLRKYKVFFVKTLWSGTEVGDGYKTTNTIELTTDGYNAPHVKEVGCASVLGGNSFAYENQNIEVYLTKKYSCPSISKSGGYTEADVSPPTPISGTLEFYIQVLDVDINKYTNYDIKNINSTSKVTYQINCTKRGPIAGDFA